MFVLYICFLVVKYNSEFLFVRKIECYIYIYVFKLILNKMIVFFFLLLFSVFLFCLDLLLVGFFFLGSLKLILS